MRLLILPRLLTLCLALAAILPQPLAAGIATPSDSAPVLVNPGFECGQGYHAQPGINGSVPNGWTGVILDQSNPYISSTNTWANGGTCNPSDMRWEKLESHDSLVMLAQYVPLGYGFVAPPFDAAIYQQVAVTPGTAYSFSGWLVSLCGGSANPNTCPAGYYMSKQVGIDPAGGTDPRAASVQWVEDRRPHTTARWVNVSVAARAQSSTLTVFVRVLSPFQHEGNHAFADAVKLVRAPTAQITVTKVSGGITASWSGGLGPDIPAIPGRTYQLYYDVQYRTGPTQPWQDWLSDQLAGSATLNTQGCIDRAFQFRVRPRAVPTSGERFVGVWAESETVNVTHTATCDRRVALPLTPR
jgi:hypothetical protein